eukprot:434332-Rhodomonas_salina.1
MAGSRLCARHSTPITDDTCPRHTHTPRPVRPLPLGPTRRTLPVGPTTSDPPTRTHPAGPSHSDPPRRTLPLGPTKSSALARPTHPTRSQRRD